MVHRPINGAPSPRVCFRFQICCSVPKRGRLKGDWGEKSMPYFTTLHPCKMREGISEMHESGPNLWHRPTFDGALPRNGRLGLVKLEKGRRWNVRPLDSIVGRLKNEWIYIRHVFLRAISHVITLGSIADGSRTSLPPTTTAIDACEVCLSALMFSRSGRRSRRDWTLEVLYARAGRTERLSLVRTPDKQASAWRLYSVYLNVFRR